MYLQYKLAKGGNNMSEKEKTAAKPLVKAFEALPEHKKEVLVAYAEGMAAMAQRVNPGENPDERAS